MTLSPSPQSIWVPGGGPSLEYDVSLSSVRGLASQADSARRRVYPVHITRQGLWLIATEPLDAARAQEDLAAFFAPDPPADGAGLPLKPRTLALPEVFADLTHTPPDAMLLGLHGAFGEDGTLQALLEQARVPFTGSRMAASALAFDKKRSYACFRHWGLDVPDGYYLPRGSELPDNMDAWTLPAFVKPVCGGSSVGVTLATDHATLRAAVTAALPAGDLLIETRIAGPELSCGVIDRWIGGHRETIPLPPTEIRPVGHTYYDYDAKYVPGCSEKLTPAPQPPEIIEKVQRIAVAAHHAIGCEGYSRTDVILPEDRRSEPIVLEINTLPGMTPTSILPVQAKAAGIPFPELIDLLIEDALHRASR